MKKYQEALKSTFVISLLVMFQLIGLIHLAYLPKASHWSSRAGIINKSSNTNTPRLLYQKSIHSVNDSRKNLIAPSKTLALFFAFVLSGVIILSTAKNTDGFYPAAKIASSYSYLTLRRLRV